MVAAACPRCAKPLKRGASYCTRCGVRFERAPAPGPRDAGRGDAARPWVTVAVVAIVGLFVAGLAVGLVWGRSWSVRRPGLTATPAPSFQGPQGWGAAGAPSALPAPARAGAPPLPPLPPLPAWKRHLPADLPPAGTPAGADYRGQILTQGRFLQQPLSGAVFAGAELLQASVEKADLDGADFRGADLSQANLAGADLDGARFDEAQFHQTSFVGSDTSAVAGRTRVRDGITEAVPPPPLPVRNMGKASFRAARFNQTSLDGLDLAGANFEGAEFSMTHFRNADLTGTNLRGSRHGGSDFEGAKLDKADLRGADLTYATNLTDAQLATAVTDATTRRPQR